jgi:hypothetical protein
MKPFLECGKRWFSHRFWAASLGFARLWVHVHPEARPQCPATGSELPLLGYVASHPERILRAKARD